MATETIGRYEILSEIGRGGMAAVYLAYDPRFRRNVALKLVSVNLQEEQILRERFEREAQLIAKIEHPAIVPVYDFGEHDDRPYLVMRYMPAGALAGKIREGVFNLGYAAQILSQIAPALDAVHAQGIIHRDLKPANILLDAFGNPAISDFGIAHFSQATHDLTGSAVIGTPAYMSPEQVRGDDDLDGRSDIYALGVILFEMLAGSGPFRAPTPISVAMKHLTDPIPSILSFRKDLPIEVDQVLQKALDKDRERRYVSAADLVEELQGANRASKQVSQPIIIPTSTTDEQATEVDTGEESSAAPIPAVVPEPPAVAPLHTQSPGSASLPKKSAVPGIAGGMAGLGLCLLAACGLAGLFGVWSWLGLPGLSTGTQRTQSPAAAASEPSGTVLFSDDFSNPRSGWPIISNSRGRYSYEQDGYHIAVDLAESVLWAKTTQRFNDTSAYVDALPLQAGSEGYYGLLCRIDDDGNFYYFVIQNSGEYTIGKYENTSYQSLTDGWKRSDAIHTNTEPNRLRADCTSNTLRLYVNDVLLDEVTDGDFTSGYSGILAASLDPQGFEALFNDFIITEPQH